MSRVNPASTKMRLVKLGAMSVHPGGLRPLGLLVVLRVKPASTNHLVVCMRALPVLLVSTRTSRGH